MITITTTITTTHDHSELSETELRVRALESILPRRVMSIRRPSIS